jgi:hypothetical protein
VPRDRPPGIWESLKRALAGGETRPESPPPRAPQPPVPVELTPDADHALLAPPPFLMPDEPLPPAAGPPPDIPAARPIPSDPGAAADASEATGRPRLARGLASFSRSNADREKKFAHLLRDDVSGGEKKPQP